MHSTQDLHENPRARSRRGGGLRPRALDRVKAHIEGHVGENLTLCELAGVACVSKFHFARMFRASTGQAPMAYVRSRRIERARRELERGSRALSGLAAELGFCDQSHFTRSFRRMTGFTPGRYAPASAPGAAP